MNKRLLQLSVLLPLLVLLVPSCQKEKVLQTASGEEIVLTFSGDTFDADVETKASAVTSLPGTLYWGMATGGNAAGSSSETVWVNCTSGSVSSSQIWTGLYQTVPATSFNYYVSNASFTTAGDMTVGNNATDIVAGRTFSTSSTTPSIALNHIFARTGTFTCNTQSGYTISNVSFYIVGKSAINGTAGTYSMRSQSWTAASSTISSWTSISSTSDMYLIPGTYTILVYYTLSKTPEYTHEFSAQADVTLYAGYVNNITCTAYGASTDQIYISVGLNAWDSTTSSFGVS